MEVTEVKAGFVPGSQDTYAWRSRRHFRLLKGGHSHLVLVHYLRAGQARVFSLSLLTSTALIERDL